jgi:GAF domain-containing protein
MSIPPTDWLSADIGDMGEHIRAVDWAATPLGAPASWPQSLKTAVRILLSSRFAMWMGWGPDLTFLYNEAYATMTLGKKHPWALGKPAREVWPEVWEDITSRVRTVLDTGTATWDQALQLFLERSGYTEETYHTFSYSPLADETGAVAGMLCVVVEETDRVIGERRLSTLRELSGALASTTTEHEVLEAVERTLGGNKFDLPFSLAYLFENNATRARLVSHIGIDATHAIAPAVIETSDAAAPWPVAELLEGRTRTIVETLSKNGTPIPGLPRGAWQTPPRAAAIVPIAQQAQEQPAGFLVAGINPYRSFDAEYSGFLELIAGQMAASLANARAYEAEKQRAESLAELDRAKTVFFSNVSHEFRTPLTLLLGPA